MSCFRGKTIVIDTSIYLYKFISDNALIENMYLMVSIFKHYEIKPIFIFDGKPPEEKKEILKKRLISKINAEKKYKEIQKELEDTNKTESDKKELIVELQSLKKRFIRIKDEEIKSVKTLFDLYDVTYYDAEKEADELCAKLLISGLAWACVSDDMDMFVYGCTRVMRHMSLLNHTIIFYNINGILKDLDIHMTVFRQITVLSGTDYNINDEKQISETMKYYKIYKNGEKLENVIKQREIGNTEICEECGFYNWLYFNTEYLKNYTLLVDIYKMFKLNIDLVEIKKKYKITEEWGRNNRQIEKTTKYSTFNSKPLISDKLKEFLKSYGFIFSVM
jgi:flap endonuclease-1